MISIQAISTIQTEKIINKINKIIRTIFLLIFLVTPSLKDPWKILRGGKEKARYFKPVKLW